MEPAISPSSAVSPTSSIGANLIAISLELTAVAHGHEQRQ
jgi:hypothetical protein